ncbi:MAG: PIG-L family deacetylase [Anaerolineae bacterium]|nr:PIG-L family deacetylase [Anaerolineae bacterium]
MTIQSVVFFGAHPDDETMLIGGVLAMLAQRADLHIVCATGGEGGELGEPPAAPREQIGVTREAELRCAVAALGAVSLDLLGYVDPLIGPGDELSSFEADFETLVRQTRDLITQYAAGLVLTHGSDGEYGHPAHVLLHKAALAAVDGLPEPPLLYTGAGQVPGIEDHIWNKSDPAHFALDVTPWLDIKERAALCHVSQHALFKRRRQLKTVREALRTVESVYRRRPALAPDEAPGDPFAALLLGVGAWRPDHSAKAETTP